jgi:hypothetical protein
MTAQFAHHRGCRRAHGMFVAGARRHAWVGEDVAGPDVGEESFEADAFCAGGSEDGGTVGCLEGLRAVD